MKQIRFVENQVQSKADIISKAEINEMIFNAHYHDEKRLKEVVQETASRVNMRITASGHIAAAKRARNIIDVINYHIFNSTAVIPSINCSVNRYINCARTSTFCYWINKFVNIFIISVN